MIYCIALKNASKRSIFINETGIPHVAARGKHSVTFLSTDICTKNIPAFLFCDWQFLYTIVHWGTWTIAQKREIQDAVKIDMQKWTSSGFRLVSRTSATITSVSMLRLTSGWPLIPTRQCSLLWFSQWPVRPVRIMRCNWFVFTHIISSTLL